MGAFDDLIPAASTPKAGGMFADLIPPDGGVTAGGVQDWQPSVPESGVMDRINTGVNWMGTRATKALTGLAGTPRALADLTQAGFAAVGLPNARMLDPVSIIARQLPSTGQMNDAVFKDAGVPEVNAPGRVGKVVDAATEAALGTIVLPGSLARNLIPAATGGAAQEAAGQATEGSKFEPVARLSAGLVAGGGAALAQNALGNVGQGAKNVLRPNTDEVAAKIIGRAMERDKTPGNVLAAARDDLGPGAMVVEAGGPNVRGTLRGAIAAPGEARTNVQNAFDERILGSNSRTTAALDKAISPNGSLATTVDDLATQRAAAARPAYEAAGVPPRNALASADKLMLSDDVLTLFKDSPDVQAALRNARRVPELKGEPINSMAVLDRVYKHIGGLEEAARRSGNNVRAGDLRDLRTRLAGGIGEENAAYTNALASYSEPSKLIDAAGRGREWFTKNVDPAVAGKEFKAMSPDQQQAALTGIRDWARTTAGRSDRGIAAERVWAGGDNRARLQAILDAPGFEGLAKQMGVEKNAIATSRDIRVGSRTAPMALEASDNAGQAVNALAEVGRGRFGAAAGKALSGLFDRIAEGKTEAVNAKIAELLSSSDPKTVAAVMKLLEAARVKEAARAVDRKNALQVGGVASPAVNALAGERR